MHPDAILPDNIKEFNLLKTASDEWHVYGEYIAVRFDSSSKSYSFYISDLNLGPGGEARSSAATFYNKNSARYEMPDTLYNNILNFHANNTSLDTITRDYAIFHALAIFACEKLSTYYGYRCWPEFSHPSKVLIHYPSSFTHTRSAAALAQDATYLNTSYIEHTKVPPILQCLCRTCDNRRNRASATDNTTKDLEEYNKLLAHLSYLNTGVNGMTTNHQTENPLELKAISEWNAIESTLDTARLLGLHVLLYGVPGTGKTTAAFKAAERWNSPTTTVDFRTGAVSLTMHGDQSVQELVGHFVPGEGGVWKFLEGPVTQAFKLGQILIMNEIDRAAGPVLTNSYAIMDDPEVARLVTPSGEVNRHNSFMVVATTNENPSEWDMPAALQDRMPIQLNVKVPHPNAVKKLNSLHLRQMVWDVYEPNTPLHKKISYRQLSAIDKLSGAGMEISKAVKCVVNNTAIAREMIAALQIAGY